MIIRHSRLNGCFENEVDDFIATVENEFCLEVESLVVKYHDCLNDIDVLHTFKCSSGDSNYEEIE